jgi:hypothetical protein
MENRGLRRSNSSPDSLDRSIGGKNSDNPGKIREGTSNSRNSLWQRVHKELLEQQSLSPAKQTHSLTEQTQKVADVAPQESLHRPDGWGQKNQDAVDILRKWENIATDADEIKKKEGYNYLPKYIRNEYEQLLKIHDFSYTSYAEGYIKKDMLNLINEHFDHINTIMKKNVEDFDKVYHFTGQTLEKHSSEEWGSEDEIDSLKKKIAGTAEEMGWKDFMERATEIIQKVNSDHCLHIIDAARESGDRSVEESLLKLASNENNRISIRTQSVYALSHIGNASTIEKLENMLQNQNSPSMHGAISRTCKVIKGRLYPPQPIEIDFLDNF